MLKLIAAAAALTLLASPALATPNVPQEAPAASQDAGPQLSPEASALLQEVENRAMALEAAIAPSRPQGLAIQADASLSQADKMARADALLVPYQAEFDSFLEAVNRFVTVQAANEGATPEQVSMITQSLPQQLRGALVADLLGLEN